MPTASHSEYLTSLMTLAYNYLWTLAFAARILSSDIFFCCCFLGFIFGLISRACCIVSRLTLGRSEAHQVKMSLFFASASVRCNSSSVYSFAPIMTSLSGTACSSGTVFVSS
jgi:hypothetical protein